MPEFSFTGKVKWAKVYPGMKDKYDKCTLNFYPSPDDLKTIMSWKLRGGVKSDEDGMYFIFSRKVNDTKAPGNIIVLDEEGNVFDKSIGNGSTVEITLQTYTWDNDFGKGTGARIQRVRVLDWVEYKKPDTTPDPNAWKPSLPLQ